LFCDALTLAAVVDELRARALGGRVQGVVQVSELSIGLEIYARGQRAYLLVSADPAEGGRVHLVPDRLRRGPALHSPLLLRLRQLAVSGGLTDVQQPPGERILRLTIAGSKGTGVLVCEVMGRRSNIILVGEDGTVLECARRVPARQNRVRVVLPGHLYVPPPPQAKAHPGELAVREMQSYIEQMPPSSPAWRALVNSVRSVSPLMAREVVFRACGDPEATDVDAAAILQSLRQLMEMAEGHQWQPSVGLAGGQIVSYAPYPLTHLAGSEAQGSMSQAMTAYYAVRTGRDAYAKSRERVQDAISEQRARQLRKRESLVRAQMSEEAIRRLRQKGEWLLAFAHLVQPGQQELVLDEGQAGEFLRIDLEPTRTAVENAQGYFHSYAKAKAAAEAVPSLLQEVDADLEYLAQLATDLELAQDRQDIDGVQRSLVQAGFLPRTTSLPRPSALRPVRVKSAEGFVILVGRNSRENEELTFSKSSPGDLWLHARGHPGGHVLVRTGGRDVPEATLRRAAELAAYYSAGRHEKRVPVDYVQRKHVRRAKGGRLGQVVYVGQKTIVVTPAP